MGLILIAIILIVGGIIVNRRFGHNNETFGGIIMVGVGSILGIICLISVIVVPINTKATRIHYKQDSTFVANACKNPNLTESERLQAINYAISWNTGIGENKYYRHTFLLCWLYKDIEDLTPMNIDSIMPADNKLTIQKK